MEEYNTGAKNKKMINAHLISQLKRHEGFRGRVYRCPAGKLTVGYGFNLDDNDIPEDIADLLLRNKLIKIMKEMAKREELDFISMLNEPRQDVLINMAYNMGIDGLLKWKNTLKEIAEGNYDKAANRMELSLWAAQVGNRAKELANQMRTGEYQDEE